MHLRVVMVGIHNVFCHQVLGGIGDLCAELNRHHRIIFRPDDGDGHLGVSHVVNDGEPVTQDETYRQALRNGSLNELQFYIVPMLSRNGCSRLESLGYGTIRFAQDRAVAGR